MPDFSALVTANTLNLRRDPSTANPPLAKLSRGTEVQILETLDKWYRVDSPKGEGYLHGDYLTIIDPSPCVGFLHEREDLQAIPLEPSAAERVRLPAEATSTQKGVARTWNRHGGMLGVLSATLETQPASSVAVLQAESSGKGFAADGRMIIRFENHVFWRRWGKEHPEVFQEHFQFSASRAWQGHKFRSQPGGDWAAFHGKQSREWQVLDFARELDEHAALLSISMGAPQIMGFNHSAIGYESPRTMFDNFSADARYHILGLFDFLKGAGCSSPMLEALRTRRFEDFAARYNGPGQAAAYGHRIESFHDAFLTLRA